jgi:hypothetical protein
MRLPLPCVRPPQQLVVPLVGQDPHGCKAAIAERCTIFQKAGRAVTLVIQVRRFFCPKRTCPRKIFAEQLPELCRPHAQRTKRLQKALYQLGLAVGGQAGAKVGSEQGLSGSRDTILRLVRTAELPAAVPPKKVGVDDWVATRSCMYSCKDSRKEALTWGAAPSAEPSLNQVRLGQCSHVRKDGD